MSLRRAALLTHLSQSVEKSLLQFIEGPVVGALSLIHI